MTARLWRSFKGRHYLDAIVLTSATLDSPGSSVPREASESNGGAFSQIRRELDIAKFDNLQVDLCNKFAPAKFGTMSFRSEEHTSELQSLMRISYAVFCLQTKKLSHKN